MRSLRLCFFWSFATSLLMDLGGNEHNELTTAQNWRSDATAEWKQECEGILCGRTNAKRKQGKIWNLEPLVRSVQAEKWLKWCVSLIQAHCDELANWMGSSVHSRSFYDFIPILLPQNIGKVCGLESVRFGKCAVQRVRGHCSLVYRSRERRRVWCQGLKTFRLKTHSKKLLHCGDLHEAVLFSVFCLSRLCGVLWA